MVQIERTWHYLILTRDQGVAPDEARGIVAENQHRVEKEKALGGAIFDKENIAFINERVGLQPNLFDPHIN